MNEKDLNLNHKKSQENNKNIEDFQTIDYRTVQSLKSEEINFNYKQQENDSNIPNEENL